MLRKGGKPRDDLWLAFDWRAWFGGSEIVRHKTEFSVSFSTATAVAHVVT